MSHTQTRARIVLVAENPIYFVHADSALSTCPEYVCVEVRDCVEAVDWLQDHEAEFVVVSLPTTNFTGLTLLRQSWYGPLICLCDDEEGVVAAVRAAHGLAVLPPFAPRQIHSALHFALQLRASLLLNQPEEEHLERVKRQLRTLTPLIKPASNFATSSQNLVWDWNLVTNEVLVNEAMYRAFGYEVGPLKLPPSWWSNRIHAEDKDRVFGSLNEALESGEEVRTCEYRFLRGDSTYAEVLGCCFIQRDGAGKPYRIVGTIHDIGGHVQTEQELRESERRLEQAQRMEAVGRLAGGIAHDFNNLLTVIGSYSDLSLRKLEEGHVVRRYVDQIRKASSTAATLTRQLLAFSRRQVLQPRVMVLNEAVDEISFMVQSLLGAGIELRIHLDSELGQIEADPVQLQQVLLNLIVNAKDAMPDGGLLNIETRNFELDTRYALHFPNIQPGSYVRLTVADTGIGMDAATLARMYEPFFTTKPKGRGTGLGLPTVYGIVQQSGGHISVYSEVEQGTTFHIYLPRVDKTFVQEGTEEEVNGILSGQETILLVEDEQAVRELATMILQEAGYHLLAASTPEEAMALERAYAGDINLLLTDVIMPGMTGREVALQMTRLRPNIPVLYMSGYTEDVMAFQQLLEIGAYLVEKPFYPKELLRMVRRAIEQPHRM